MADTPDLEARTRDSDRGAPRKHHRRRWALAGVAALFVLLVLAAVAVKPRPGPPPLVLPTAAGTASAQAGPVGGRWNVGAGSVAGFRVRQILLGGSGDIVGRTNTVSGAIAVSHNQLVSAAFRIDLTTIKVEGGQHTRPRRTRRRTTIPQASGDVRRGAVMRREVA